MKLANFLFSIFIERKEIRIKKKKENDNDD